MSLNDLNSELYEQVKDLVDEGRLNEDSPEYGIAQQVLDRGYESLSHKQKYLYDSAIVPALTKRQNEVRVNEILGSNPQ